MVPEDRQGWSAASQTPAPEVPFRAWLCPDVFGSMLFAAVAFEIEGEHAIEACGSHENLGMAQRTDRIVVAGTPMVLHREPGKLVVLGVAFVIPGAIDQMDDVVDLVAGDRLQDVQVIVLL